MKYLLTFLICLASIGLSTLSFSATTIDAQVVRNQDGSGECLISSGFPLPKGLVTEQMIRYGVIRILVNGSEVPCNITALRGRHFDGTLRSILIQFSQSMAKGDVLAAQVVVDDGARSYPDTEYTRPILAIVQNNNVIVPTSKDYLVSTQLVFRNLLKEGASTTSEEKLYTYLAEDRFDSLCQMEDGETDVDGTASYENVSAMLAMWCRLGDYKFHKRALKKTLEWLPYNTPNTDCGSAALVANPDGRTDGTNNCSFPSEWDAPRVFSYAQMYLLTGYRDFWGIVALNAQRNQPGDPDINSQDSANTNVILAYAYDTPRYNYTARYGMLLAALQIDATIRCEIPGAWAQRTTNLNDQLDWTINAIYNSAWDLKWIPFSDGTGNVPAFGTNISQGSVSAKLLGVWENRNGMISNAGTVMPSTGYIQVNNITGGSFTSGSITGISASATGEEESDYRQGFVGTRSYSPRFNYDNSGRPTHPIFQTVFPVNFLIDYYLYIKRDSRIPAMVKADLDAVLMNVRSVTEDDTLFWNYNDPQWGPVEYVHPYQLDIPPLASAIGDPWSLPEYPRMVAFVIKTMGDSTVNGAPYSTWYQRFVNTGSISPNFNFTWTWKNFGQFYGWGQDAPWMMSQASLVDYGPATMRIPTQWDSIPGDAPDPLTSGKIYGSGQNIINGSGTFEFQ